MYTFSRQTREKFLEEVGIDLTYFFDELCSRKVQDAIIALTEIEYKRGLDDGTNDIDALMEQQYNCGYDDAMRDCEESHDQAYNEGFGQALQEAQDAILHIGRAR